MAVGIVIKSCAAPVSAPLARSTRSRRATVRAPDALKARSDAIRTLGPRLRLGAFRHRFASMATRETSVAPQRLVPLIDIAANLTDGMFRGEYHGRSCHGPDLDRVLERAWAGGVERIIVTGTDLSESREALRIAMTDPRLFSTVGVHPTMCGAFESAEVGAGGGRSGDAAPGGGGKPPSGVDSMTPRDAEAATEEGGGADSCGSPREAYLAELIALLRMGKEEGKAVALGELGLDAERTRFCPLQVQERWFARQLEAARGSGLPLFLHLRGEGEVVDAFFEILDRHADAYPRGVVHSFDGSLDTLARILEPSRRLSVGLNGCSLREERSREVVAAIPGDRLLLETDAPWCGVKRTHAGAAAVTAWPPTADAKRVEAKRERLLASGGGGCAAAAAEALALQVKGRNEPSNVSHVLDVVAAYRGQAREDVAAAAYENAMRMFWPEELEARAGP